MNPGNGLPEGWREEPLTEIVEFAKRPKGLDRAGRAPFLPMAAISESGSDITSYSEAPASKSGAYFEEGDFLLARITPCFENAKRGIARNVPGGWGNATTEVYAMRSEVLTPEYLWIFFSSPIVHDRLLRTMEGATGRMRVPKSALEALRIQFPSRPEQDRIVATVMRALEGVVGGEESLVEATQKCQVLREATLNSRLFDAAGETEPLGRLLEGIEAGKSLRCDGEPADEGEWGILKVSAMTWGRFRPEENKRLADQTRANPKWEVAEGDLLLSRANTTDYVGANVLVEDCPPKLLLSDKSLRLQPADGIDQRWLSLALSSPLARHQISRLATGTKDSMRNISQQKLKSIRLPVPDRARQRELAGEVARTLTELHDLESRTIDIARREAEMTRNSVLHHAFAGQLTK